MNKLNFVDIEDIASKKRKSYYTRYVDASKNIQGIIIDQINSSPAGIAILKIADVAEAIDMSDKSNSALHRGLKFALWNEDIVVSTAVHQDGDGVFVFRSRKDTDKLPKSLEELLV